MTSLVVNMTEEAEKMVVVGEGNPIDGVHETNEADDAMNAQVIVLFHISPLEYIWK